MRKTSNGDFVDQTTEAEGTLTHEGKNFDLKDNALFIHNFKRQNYKTFEDESHVHRVFETFLIFALPIGIKPEATGVYFVLYLQLHRENFHCTIR